MSSNQSVFENTQETIKDLQQGNLPSNKHLKEGISEIQQSISENKDSLSGQGQKIVDDVDQILDTSKMLIEEKNKNELVQKIYNQTYKATDEQTFAQRRRKLKEILMNEKNNQEKKEELSHAVDEITVILRLLISSPEFREFINDIETVFEKTFIVQHQEHSSGKYSAQSKSNSDDQNPRQFYFGSKQPSKQSNYSSFIRFDTKGNVKGKIGDEISIGDADQSISKQQAADEFQEVLIEHWTTMALVLHEHPQYRQAISYLIRTFNHLASHISHQVEKLEKVQQQEQNKPQNQKADQHATKAWENAKKFIENWVSDDYSLDEFLNSLENLTNQAKNDEELKQYFDDLLEFFEKSAADKNYVENQEKMKQDAKEKINKAKELFHGKYKQQFEKFFDELQYLNDAIQNDEGVNQLQDDFKQLTNDLFYDEKGNPTIHTDLIKDLQSIIPSLVSRLRRLPLPDLDFSDERSDLTIRNAVLDCGDIAPSYFRFTICGSSEDNHSYNNHVKIVISKIRARILNAEFSYNKKTFPNVNDQGIADLFIYGNSGMTLAMEVCPSSDAKRLTLKKNLCRIDKVNLRMKQTSHDVLYGFLSPIINAYVKSKLENLIEHSVKEIIEDSTEQAKQLFEKSVQKTSEAVDVAQQKFEEVNMD